MSVDLFKRRAVFVFTVTLFALNAPAQIRLHSLFTSHMVLQRDREITLYGWAGKGEGVTVSLSGTSRSATADDNGTWRIGMPSMPAGGPHSITVKGTNTIVLEDVLIGDVFLTSGQSNMRWPLNDAGDTIPTNTAIRIFNNRSAPHLIKQEDFPGVWEVAQAGDAAHYFSIVSYYFARYLQPQINIPVGILVAPQGGSHIDNWLDRETFVKADGNAEPILAIVDRETAAKGAAWDQWYNDMVDFNTRTYNGQTGLVEPVEPALEPCHYKMKGSYPMRCFNSYLYPCRNFPIKAMLWYQGEYNAGEFGSPTYHNYYNQLSGLIGMVRNLWNDSQLPFLIVQLPGRGSGERSAAHDWRSSYAPLRMHQLNVNWSVPHTALVTTIDSGGDLHPPLSHKIPIGYRLSLAARSLIYDEKIVSSGPQVDRVYVENGRVKVRFSDVGGGLKSLGGQQIRSVSLGFTDISQRNDPTLYFSKTATIEDAATMSVVIDTSVLPDFVSYAYTNFPVVDIYNTEEIPASPFLFPVPFDRKGMVVKNKTVVYSGQHRAGVKVRADVNNSISYDLMGRKAGVVEKEANAAIKGVLIGNGRKVLNYK